MRDYRYNSAIKKEVRVIKVNKEIGLRIKHLREERKISQSALGEAIGVSYQQVQKYEKGISPITVERLQQIAKALGIAPADFLVNKFEDTVKERLTRYEQGKLKSGIADLTKDESGLLKAYKSIGSKRLRQSILSHLKIIAKMENALK